MGRRRKRIAVVFVSECWSVTLYRDLDDDGLVHLAIALLGYQDEERFTLEFDLDADQARELGDLLMRA